MSVIHLLECNINQEEKDLDENNMTEKNIEAEFEEIFKICDSTCNKFNKIYQCQNGEGYRNCPEHKRQYNNLSQSPEPVAKGERYW